MKLHLLIDGGFGRDARRDDCGCDLQQRSAVLVEVVFLLERNSIYARNQITF